MSLFDPFAASTTQVDEVSKHFTIQVIALGQLLIAKGVITEDELMTSITVATAKVDQLWAERQEELSKDNPGLAFFEKILGGE